MSVSATRFPWESTSYYQALEQTIWPFPPEPTWIQELERFDMQIFSLQEESLHAEKKEREEKKERDGSPRLERKDKEGSLRVEMTDSDGSPRKEIMERYGSPALEKEKIVEEQKTILHTVIAYLAAHPNQKLEQILAAKFEQLAEKNAHAIHYIFRSIFVFSISEKRLAMLDVCKRVISLNLLLVFGEVTDVSELARDEARFVPRPNHIFEPISKILMKAWHYQSHLIRDIARYIIGVTILAYGCSWSNLPADPQKAQGLWSFYRDTVYDAVFIFPTIKSVFFWNLKVTLATMAIFTTYMGAAYLYHRLHSAIHPILNEMKDVEESTETLKTYLSSSLKSLDLLDEKRVSESLTKLRKSRDERKLECLKARNLDPRWNSTPDGRKMFDDMKHYDKLTERYEKKLLEEEPKLRQYINYLSQLLIDFRQKEQKAIHFFVDQENKFPGKPLDEEKKTYLFFKYIALPIINKEVAAYYRRYKEMFGLPKPLKISA